MPRPMDPVANLAKVSRWVVRVCSLFAGVSLWFGLNFIMLVTMQLLWMYLQPLKVILRSHELLCSVTFCTSFPTCILSAYSQGVAAVIIGSGPDVSFNGANEVPYMTFV